MVQARHDAESEAQTDRRCLHSKAVLKTFEMLQTRCELSRLGSRPETSLTMVTVSVNGAGVESDVYLMNVAWKTRATRSED